MLHPWRVWCRFHRAGSYRVSFHLPPKYEDCKWRWAVRCDGHAWFSPRIPTSCSSCCSECYRETNPLVFNSVCIFIHFFKAKNMLPTGESFAYKMWLVWTGLLTISWKRSLFLSIWSQCCSWHVDSVYLVWFRVIKLGFSRIYRNMKHKDEYSFIGSLESLIGLDLTQQINTCFTQRPFAGDDWKSEGRWIEP